jgi:hypothetical protein
LAKATPRRVPGDGKLVQERQGQRERPTLGSGVTGSRPGAGGCDSGERSAGGHARFRLFHFIHFIHFMHFMHFMHFTPEIRFIDRGSEMNEMNK